MVKVYFQHPTNWYRELVAYFDTEETYMICLPALEKLAEEANMVITENIVEDKLRYIDRYKL